MSEAAIPSYGIAEQDIDRLSQFLHSNAPELPDFDDDLPAVEVAIDMLMREFGVTVPMCFAIETEAQLVAYLQRSPDQDGEGA